MTPKSAKELSETYRIPIGRCAAILDFLDRRGYVSNVVTLFAEDGEPVKYYLRTERKIPEVDDELNPKSMKGTPSQSP